MSRENHPFHGSRIEELTLAAEARMEKSAPNSPEYKQAKEQTQLTIYAAQGVEYILAASKSQLRAPVESLSRWLDFSVLSNPTLFTPENLKQYRVIMNAMIEDFRDMSTRP